MDNAPLRNGYGIDTWCHWWIRRISRKSTIQKDRTMEKINEVLKDYARVLEEALVDGILQEGLLKTGELGRSVRVNYDERKEVFSIKMEDYGYYQDSGVHGIERRQPKNPESLFNPGQFRSYVIGGPLPFPVRKSIAQKGFRPRPFIVKSYNQLVDQYLDEALLEAGEEDINKINVLTSTESLD
mgnify:CR=1 FL=1